MASIDLAMELLPSPQKCAYCRLLVFEGGWYLKAVKRDVASVLGRVGGSRC